MPTSIELFGGTMLSPVPDPYSVYRRLRRDEPVILVQGLLGEDHLVTRYDDVVRLLKEPDLFSSRGNARGIGLVMGRTILEMEGVEHVRHRKLATPFLSANALRSGLEDSIHGIAHSMIDAFAADGHADLVAQFTFTFPIRVITHIIGIPMDDYASFHRWAIDLISVGDDPPRGFAASQRIVDYLRPVLEQRKVEPQADLLSALVHAEVEGQRLTDDEVLSFLRLLVPAGAETSYRLIGSTLFALLSHPEALAAVRSDTAAIDLAIEETLRWESPVQYVTRETTRDAIVSAHLIPAGSLVSACLGSANRDEEHYASPDAFQLNRNPEDHVAFGLGSHFCAGSFLARAETRIAVEAIVQRLPNLRLDPTQPGQVVGLAFRSPDRLAVHFDRRSA